MQLIIKDENDTEKLITSQTEVENEIYSFYNNLFECKDNFIEIESVEEFLGTTNSEKMPMVNNHEKASMEGKISLLEMTNYLKKSKNNVAPGSSGFTNEFYKFFWRDLKIFVINAVDFAFENHRLAASQKLGIISIIQRVIRIKGI